MTVQVIMHCGDTLLVGVNGKEVFGKDAACKGEVDGEPYVGFSSQQMNEAASVKELYPCPVCGEAVPVQTIGATKTTVVGR